MVRTKRNNPPRLVPSLTSVAWNKLCIIVCLVQTVQAFVPLIDGGKDIPKLYKGYFDAQIAKQAATAVSKAVGAGKTKIEVNFPPVPNLDEVRR